MDGREFQKSIRTQKVACIGAGYVGGPTMSVLAFNCPTIEFYVLDVSKERISAWNSDKLPFFEPSLDNIVKQCRGKNLFFSTDLEQGIDECDIIFICVSTPTKWFGIGKGLSADLRQCEAAVRQIAALSKRSKIIVEKSTVPVRTADGLSSILKTNRNPEIEFVVLSNPEFLAEGTAISDLMKPDRVIVGGPQHTELGRFSINVLVEIYATWVPKEKILTMSLSSSEMSKLVTNAFLAQRVSSINSITAICEATGADIRQVSMAIGMDRRLGSSFLNPSVGFGGSCFQKDLLNLVYMCDSHSLSEVARYWEEVVKMNNFQKCRFTAKVIKKMFSNVSKKKIAVFGFAYKKDTSDTRETPALDVCAALIAEHAIVHVYDPKVSKMAALKEFYDHGYENKLNFKDCFKMEQSTKAACNGAHAIVVLTEWDEFKYLDYSELYGIMNKPAFVFDGRNLLDHSNLYAIGFEVYGIGIYHSLPCHTTIM